MIKIFINVMFTKWELYYPFSYYDVAINIFNSQKRCLKKSFSSEYKFCIFYIHENSIFAEFFAFFPYNEKAIISTIKLPNKKFCSQ